jgi:hypothetical protein
VFFYTFKQNETTCLLVFHDKEEGGPWQLRPTLEARDEPAPMTSPVGRSVHMMGGHFFHLTPDSLLTNI